MDNQERTPSSNYVKPSEAPQSTATDNGRTLACIFAFIAVVVIFAIAEYQRKDERRQAKYNTLSRQLDDLYLQQKRETKDSLDARGLWQTRVDYDIQMYQNAIAKFDVNTSLATQAEYYRKLCEAQEKREEIRKIGEYFTQKFQQPVDSIRLQMLKLQKPKS